MDVAGIALIVLVILGTGIIGLSFRRGSFAWRWKNRFLGEISAETKGETAPGIVQIQSESEDVEQIVAKDTSSQQEQKKVKRGKQTIK